MVKVSESRSTARRSILRKCAAVMPLLSQPTPQDSMPEAFPRMGNGRPVTDDDYHAYVSDGRNPGVAAARARASSLPGWRSYAQHPTAAHPYEFTLGPAGVPAGGSAVGQYAPAAAERQ